MNEIKTITILLLSIQRALLGEITPNIRGITCDLYDSQIIIRCYFEGQVTKDNKESIDSVEAEVIADFPKFAIDLQCLMVNKPESLEQYKLSAWVYMRKE